MRAKPQTPYHLEPNQRIELRSIGSDGLIDTMEAGSGEMFFFFVGGMEQGARWVVKEAAGRCLQGGVELLGCCSVSAEPTKSSRPSTVEEGAPALLCPRVAVAREGPRLPLPRVRPPRAGVPRRRAGPVAAAPGGPLRRVQPRRRPAVPVLPLLRIRALNGERRLY